MVSPAKEKITLFTDKLLIYPEMKDNGPLSKNAVLGLQAYVLGMALITWMAGVSVLFSYWTIFMVLGAVPALIYQVSGRNNMEVFIFAGMFLTTLVTIYFIHLLGGITASAGLVLAGPVVIITSIILERKDWTYLLMTAYIAMIVLSLLLPGQQDGSTYMTQGQNVLYFTLNAIFLGVYVAVPAIRLIDRQKENEDLKRGKQDEQSYLLQAKSRLYSDITRQVEGMLTGITDIQAKHVDRNTSEILKQVAHHARKVKLDLVLKKELALLESRSTRIRSIQSDFIKFSKYIADELAGQALTRNVKILYNTQINQFNLDFDPVIVMRIMSYLVSDSIRRTGTDGAVTVGISREEENSWMDLLVISVSDAAKPLEQGLRELIFTPDYDHVNEMAATYGSSAPGLMMAGELIRMLNGRIQIRAKERKGTTFRIQLPVHNASRFAGHDELLRSMGKVPWIIPVNGKEDAEHLFSETHHYEDQDVTP